ncbi:MAG: 6,7-dimethyl-8-ribityllumazine synthase [Planctomycetota bacterium]
MIVARWPGEITARLLVGARQALAERGVADEDGLVVEGPGAFEIPQVAMRVAEGLGVDAIVALGCVIRGETPHFDHVARTCTDGCLQVALATGIPVGLGVITADTRAQADARSENPGGGISKKGGNKGIEAADAAVRLARTFRHLDALAPEGGEG